MQGKGDKYITLKDGKSVNNAQWHTVTYAFDGTHAEFYLDGASIGKIRDNAFAEGRLDSGYGYAWRNQQNE